MQLLKFVIFPLVFAILIACFPYEARSQSVITEYLKKVASDASAGDEFGVSVAVEGDWAVIGAQSVQDVSHANDLGAAYVYYRHQGGPNQWGEFKKLITTTPGSGNRFLGASAAISGDTIVVGAYQPDRKTAGAIYIFERNQGGTNKWGEVKMIVPSDGVGGDQFGFSVDIDEDIIVVGANSADASSLVSNSGVAYVYERNAGGPDNWGKVRKLEPTAAFENDFFGESVAISGDSIAVGVPGDDDFAINGGSVCLFNKDTGGLGQWGFVKKIAPSLVFMSDQFGNAVSLYGDTLVAGASLADTTDVNTGAVYVFERNSGGENQWGQARQLMAAPLGSDQFGSSVSIDEDEIAVGAYNASVGGNRVGSLYRFQRDQGGAGHWGLVTLMRASDGATGDKFGQSVSIHGDVIFGGASWNDDAGDRSGSAYVYWFPPIPPVLSIVDSGTNVVITWDPASPDFVLQQTWSLDSGDWTNVPSGNLNPVVLSKEAATGFFRLALP